MTQLLLNLGDFVAPTIPEKAKIEFLQPPGTDPRVGHCGIVACAFAAGRKVDCLHRQFIRAFANERAIQRGVLGVASLRRGGTSHDERIAILEACEVEHTDIPMKRCQLRTLVRKLDPEKYYMVRVTRHVVTVHNGMVMDQSGIAPIAEHWTARKLADRCTEYTPKR